MTKKRSKSTQKDFDKVIANIVSYGEDNFEATLKKVRENLIKNPVTGYGRLNPVVMALSEPNVSSQQLIANTSKTIDWSKVSLSSRFKLNGAEACCTAIKLGLREYGGFQVQITQKKWSDHLMGYTDYWPGAELPYGNNTTCLIYIKYLEDADLEIVEY